MKRNPKPTHSAVNGREEESLIGVPGLSNFLLEVGRFLRGGGTWERAGSLGVENSKEPLEIAECSLPGRSTGEETLGLEVGEIDEPKRKGVEEVEETSS